MGTPSSDLEDKIKKEKEAQAEKNPVVRNIGAGAEFISPMLGGLLLGYFLDRWLDTAPIFLISLFLMGVGGGFYSIYKASQDNSAEDQFSQLHKGEKDAKTSAKETKVDEQE